MNNELQTYKELDFDIDPNDEVQVEALKVKLVKGLSVLQCALFNQAGFESKRMTGLRKVIGKFEDEIFDPKFIELITDPELKFKLYKLALANMNNGMSFLQELNKNVTSSMEALDNMNKLKPPVLPEGTEPDKNEQALKDQILELIANEIAKKVKPVTP